MKMVITVFSRGIFFTVKLIDFHLVLSGAGNQTQLLIYVKQVFSLNYTFNSNLFS